MNNRKLAAELPDTIKISVKDWHIKQGVREDCSYCPIALAIIEKIQFSPALERSWEVVKVFDADEILIRDVKYTCPKWVNQWLVSFDDKDAVYPIEFTLVKYVMEYEDNVERPF